MERNAIARAYRMGLVTTDELLDAVQNPDKLRELDAIATDWNTRHDEDIAAMRAAKQRGER